MFGGLTIILMVQYNLLSA